MSVICSKEYTVTIAAAPVTILFGYWKCEEAAPPVVDSSGHTNFITTVAGSILSVGGIIGNGLDMNSWDAKSAVSTDYRFLAHDFSLRLWVKPYYGGGYSGDGLSLLLNNDGDFADYSWEFNLNPFNYQLGPSWSVWDSTNTEKNVCPNSILTNAWHHVYCWVQSGVEIGMKIDNGASTTTPFTTIYTTPGNRLHFNRGASGGGDPHNYVDEIAIWNRMLTPAEITADYNGGVGETYPNVPL